MRSHPQGQGQAGQFQSLVEMITPTAGAYPLELKNTFPRALLEK